MAAADDPFRNYHRESRRRSARRVSLVAVLAAAVVAIGVWLSPHLAPTTPPMAADAGGSDLSVVRAAAVVDAVAPAPPVTLPVEQRVGPPADDALPPAPPVQAGPQTFDIHVDTTGFQDEIDRCLWVRMDIGAAAPIVGRHNHCGGDLVLAMQPGDLVSLTGTGLDGAYIVSGSRDAHAGDNAADATAGLEASVILQTCYTRSTTVRLVTLVPSTPS